MIDAERKYTVYVGSSRNAARETDFLTCAEVIEQMVALKVLGVARALIYEWRDGSDIDDEPTLDCRECLLADGCIEPCPDATWDRETLFGDWDMAAIATEARGG